MAGVGANKCPFQSIPFKSVSPSSRKPGESGIRLSRWEEVRDAPFKTSVETENNKLA